jgi:hypothetical protein
MNAPPPSQQQQLALRHQALVQRAQQERAALLQASSHLLQPLRWLERVSPWLALGWRLSRLWQRRKV